MGVSARMQDWRSLFVFAFVVTHPVCGVTPDTFFAQPILRVNPEDDKIVFPNDPISSVDDPSDSFNDSAIIDEFNERYIHRMVARTAAIVLRAGQQTECADQEEECSAWAEAGYCFSNAGYMSVACPRSCDVCDLSVCADNHLRCGEWAVGGECTRNPSYMNVACRASCGICGTASLVQSQALEKVCEEEDTNYQGRVGSSVVPGVQTWPECSALCDVKEGCKAWSWVREGTGSYALNCALMEGFSNRAADTNTVAGPKGCKPSGSTETFTTTSSPDTSSTIKTTPCEEIGVNYQGRSGSSVVRGVKSASECSQQCRNKNGCNAWVWVVKGDYAQNCGLMEAFTNRAPDPNT